jgi:hypothetical protein
MIRFNQRLLVVLGMAICVLSSIALAEIGSPQVEWDQSSPITWDLFQGTPPAESIHRREPAQIAVNYGWHADFTAEQSLDGTWVAHATSVVVTLHMVLANSWANLSLVTPHILQHEQLHFDLYEVYHRKLELCMLEIRSSSSTTGQGAFNQLQTSLAHVFSTILQTANETQALYDSQTSHSTNAAEQARWQGLISQWLIEPTTAP